MSLKVKHLTAHVLLCLPLFETPFSEADARCVAEDEMQMTPEDTETFLASYRSSAAPEAPRPPEAQASRLHIARTVDCVADRAHRSANRFTAGMPGSHRRRSRRWRSCSRPRA